MSKSRNAFIDCMKIFATLGVFMGHYMNTFCEDLVLNLRSNVLVRSVFGFLFMGDYCVVFFFVASGWLLSYYWTKTKDVVKQILTYSIRLFIPSILMILVTAIVYYIISFAGDGSFNLYNIWSDIRNILSLGDGEHRIYYAYQLWYIPSQVYGYTICSIIYATVESYTKKKKYIILIMAVLFLALFNNSYAEIMLGVLCGSICKEYGETIGKCFRKVWSIFLAVMLFLLSQNIIGMWGYTFDLRKYLAGYVSALAFAYILLISSGSEKRNSVIARISSYTFSIYLVHVLVLSIFQKINNAYLNSRYSNVWGGVWTIGILIITILCSIAYKIIYEKVVKTILKKISIA